MFMLRLALPLLLFLAALAGRAAADDRLNVLFINVDDMNWDSVGVFGCKVPDITPHIDRLAEQGMRFQHGHVTIAICQPTRAVWMTGRYPHNSGALGFNEIRRDVPTLVETLREAGYYTGVMAKTGHVVPSRANAWHERIPAKMLGNGRDPEKYYQLTKAFLENAKKAGQPFFLMANAQDPHRPFYGSEQEQQARRRDATNTNDQYGGGFPSASRVYRPEEITVPGFLPDLPEVRKELAQYYTSVHRADEVVGAVLRALDEAELEDNTLVMFLSDHGMPLPFAKTNVWLHSTRTPWIVRWPGVVQAGTCDAEHFISGIDLAPTILDAVGVEPMKGIDGRSFGPVLRGGRQAGREHVVTYIHTIASGKSYPMRSLQDARYGYIYNGWSDGETEFRNESQSGLTMAAMRRAARQDPEIAARVDHFLYRCTEEFYDYQADPDARNNLIDDPGMAPVVARYRQRLLDHMQATGDELVDEFRAVVRQAE